MLLFKLLHPSTLRLSAYLPRPRLASCLIAKVKSPYIRQGKKTTRKLTLAHLPRQLDTFGTLDDIAKEDFDIFETRSEATGETHADHLRKAQFDAAVDDLKCLVSDKHERLYGTLRRHREDIIQQLQKWLHQAKLDYRHDLRRELSTLRGFVSRDIAMSERRLVNDLKGSIELPKGVETSLDEVAERAVRI